MISAPIGAFENKETLLELWTYKYAFMSTVGLSNTLCMNALDCVKLSFISKDDSNSFEPQTVENVLRLFHPGIYVRYDGAQVFFSKE